MKKLGLSILSLVLLFSFVLVGCSTSTDTSYKGPGKLVVAGYSAERLAEQHVNYYRLTHDEIEVDVKSFSNPEDEEERVEPYQLVKRMLDGEDAPDVLFVDVETMARLAEEGYLQPIDTLAKNKKYDLDSFVPGIMEYVKNKGNGTLYGIPLSFYSSVLFYNKDFFDEAQIPYPTDNMSWDQIYDLSRQLSEGEGFERKYGLSFGNGYYDFLQRQANQRGLSLIGDDLKTVTLDTPEWRKLCEEVKSLIDEGIVVPEFDWDAAYEAGYEPGPAAYEPFLGGRAAMEIRDSSSINHFDEEFQWYGDELKPFEWDIVTIPTQANNPGYGGELYVYDLLAINKNTANLDLAWDFVSYVSGDDMTKIKSKTEWDLPTRSKYLQKEGKELNYEALYKLEPMDEEGIIPEEFYWQYDQAWEVMDPIHRNFERMMAGELDVEQGLEETQREMQAILDRLIEESESENKEG